MPRRTSQVLLQATRPFRVSRTILPAKSERALNKFLTEYDWDEGQLNREQLELLQ